MANFPENLADGWKEALGAESEQPYFQKLVSFLKQEYSQGQEIYPPREWTLRALQDTRLSDIRVVILGQDPYHGPGQAMGRSFAVPNELQPKPPSLVNIFKEMESDLGVSIDRNQSDLQGWAEQGVLMLNSVLTVRRSQAFSHRGQGWEEFTDRVIDVLNAQERPMVFFLWGAAAIKKGAKIEAPHLAIRSPHPSPLSAHRGFFGSRPFSQANEFLAKAGLPTIEWERLSSRRAGLTVASGGDGEEAVATGS
jgi:uracil-DNA glycosylase